MNKALQVIAKSVLRDTKPSVWDALGWQLYLVQTKGIDAGEETLLEEWRHAIDAEHKQFTSRYRAYAAQEGLHANYDPGEDKRRKADLFASDMGVWEAIAIKKIERVDNILQFYLEDKSTFRLNIEDIYSQLAFRKAFTSGTTVILPAISPPSYNEFIKGLEITVIEDIGTSIMEKIEEILLNQRDKLKDALVETEQEAIEAVGVRGYAMYGDEIFFKLSNLHYTLKRDTPNVTTGLLATTLRDMGGIPKKNKKFNFWKYELGANDITEPI